MTDKDKERIKKLEEEKKVLKRSFKKLKRIDGMEIGNWLMFTVIYAFFIAIMAGCATVYLADIVYVFGLPLDVQQFVWVLGLALWSVISILLKAHYERH